MQLAAGEEQQRRLIDHVLLIERWNRVHNLTALRDPLEMVTQHLLDSLAVIEPLDRHLAAKGADATPAGAARLLDVGSGAGLPGVVLAIMRPALQVTCIDAVAKKAGFIRQAAGELSITNLVAQHARVEEWKTLPFDFVTSRAFASLVDFTDLTQHLLASTGVWMAMKGKWPDEEIAALPEEIEVFHVEPLQVPGLDAQRCIVWMRRTSGAAERR
ncbi:MAG TPA: 16S rRNA (guanine(527)-N(7))-methyltransferase RsmG [Rubrivivax sp.]